MQPIFALSCDEFSAFSHIDTDVLFGDPLCSCEDDPSKSSKGALSHHRLSDTQKRFTDPKPVI